MEAQGAIRLHADAAADAYPMDRIFLRCANLPDPNQITMFEENGCLHNASVNDASVRSALARHRLAHAWLPVLLKNMQTENYLSGSAAAATGDGVAGQQQQQQQQQQRSSYSLLDLFFDGHASPQVVDILRSVLPSQVANWAVKFVEAVNAIRKPLSLLNMIGSTQFSLADLVPAFGPRGGAFRFLTWSLDGSFKLAYGDRHDRVFIHFFTSESSFDKILTHPKQRTVTNFAFHPMLDSFVAVCCESSVILWRLEFSQSDSTVIADANQQQNADQFRRRPRKQQDITTASTIQRSVRASLHKQLSHNGILTSTPTKPFTSACFSAEGTLVFACTASNNGLYAWNVVTGALVRVIDNLLQPVEIIPSPDGLLNCVRTMGSVIYVGDQYEALNYCAIPSLRNKRVTSAAWYAYGPTLFVTLEKDPLLYTLDFSAPAQWRNRYEILIQPTDAALNPIADFEAVQVTTNRRVGGFPVKLAFDLTGRRMALLLEKSEPHQSSTDTTAAVIDDAGMRNDSANYVWLFDVRVEAQLCSIDFNPIGGIGSPLGDGGAANDAPQFMSIKNNFETGALLTVGWKSGNISHVPMLFDGCERNMWQEFSSRPNVVMRSSPLSKTAKNLARSMMTDADFLMASRSAPTNLFGAPNVSANGGRQVSGGGGGNEQQQQQQVGQGRGMSPVPGGINLFQQQQQQQQQRQNGVLNNNQQQQQPYAGNYQQTSPPSSPPPVMQHANPFITVAHQQQQQQQQQSLLLNNNLVSPPPWTRSMLLNNSPLQSTLNNNSATMMLSPQKQQQPFSNEQPQQPQQQNFNLLSPSSLLQQRQQQQQFFNNNSQFGGAAVNDATVQQFLPSFSSGSNRMSPPGQRPTLSPSQQNYFSPALLNNSGSSGSPSSSRLNRPLRRTTMLMGSGNAQQLLQQQQQQQQLQQQQMMMMQNLQAASSPLSPPAPRSASFPQVVRTTPTNNTAATNPFGVSTPLQQQLIRKRLAEAARGGGLFANSSTTINGSDSKENDQSNMAAASTSQFSHLGAMPLAMSTPFGSAAKLSPIAGSSGAAAGADERGGRNSMLLKSLLR